MANAASTGSSVERGEAAEIVDLALMVMVARYTGAPANNESRDVIGFVVTVVLLVMAGQSGQRSG